MKKITYYSGSAALAVAIGVAGFAAGVNALIDEQLDRGESNADVVELQTFLAQDSSIYPEGLVTGYFGPLTESAVMRFQARFGISAVGRVGPITMAKINELMLGVGGPEIGDIHAPVISSLAVNIATTTSGTTGSATITWNTDEVANHKVYFSTTFPPVLSTATVFTDTTVDQEGRVTISNIPDGSTRFYIVESMDLSGNIQRTVPLSFTIE